LDVFCFVVMLIRSFLLILFSWHRLFRC
jgi:hypothetical protein